MTDREREREREKHEIYQNCHNERYKVFILQQDTILANVINQL